MIYRYIEFSPVSFLRFSAAHTSRSAGLWGKTLFLTRFEVIGQLKNTHPLTDTQQSWNNQIFIKPGNAQVFWHPVDLTRFYSKMNLCKDIYCINMEDFFSIDFELCIVLSLKVWENGLWSAVFQCQVCSLSIAEGRVCDTEQVFLLDDRFNNYLWYFSLISGRLRTELTLVIEPVFMRDWEFYWLFEFRWTLENAWLHKYSASNTQMLKQSIWNEIYIFFCHLLDLFFWLLNEVSIITFSLAVHCSRLWDCMCLALNS